MAAGNRYALGFGTGIILGFYALFVFSIWMNIRHSKSFDVVLPTGMNILHLVWLLLAVGDRGDMVLWSFCGLLLIVSYGISLIVLNVCRIKRREFSLPILLYQLVSWLFWTTLILFVWGVARSGSLAWSWPNCQIRHWTVAVLPNRIRRGSVSRHRVRQLDENTSQRTRNRPKTATACWQRPTR